MRAKVMLTIRLFGPPQVRVNGEPMPHLKTRKGLWLLALLALRHGREVERAWLAGTLWPENQESQSLTYLRQSLSDLRHALGPEAARVCSPSPQRTLCLNLTDADVDVVTFDECLKRGDAPSLEQAVALFGGPLLEGCAEEWVLLEREAREQAYLGALETLAEQAAGGGNAPAAVHHLRLLLTADPLRESACRALMQALAATRDYAAVTHAYRGLRLLLRQELSAEPEAETRALFDRLRAEGRQRAAAAPPERQAAAPPQAAASPFCHLPRPLSDFIGREREVEETKRCLAQARLVTLTGFGGVGKTRLALRAASEVVDEFPDGVFFTDLAPLSDPVLVPKAVAHALKAPEKGGRDLTETLSEHLQTRRLLLILDNCEHVLQASAQLADTLLRNCPDLRILATSRQHLGITGETERRVPPLALPDLERLPCGEKDVAFLLMDSEAVRLFVERARRVRPNLRLDEATLRTIAQVCVCLDGIPLAIELAAARMSVLSPDHLAARLSDRFHLLTGGSRTALPRQRTLRATIDWSYDLLSDEEKTLFRRLSVFAGGWTLPAAESVCAGDGLEDWEVLDGLAGLAERSLVVAEPDGGGFRYRLLETIRQYAAQKLAQTDEEARLRKRHHNYFLALAEEAVPHLAGAQQATWLERLEKERGNLSEVLRRCDAESKLRLAAALWRYWFIRSDFSEGRYWLEEALDQNTAATTTRARGTALYGAGNLAGQQGDFTTATRFLHEAVTVLEKAGDRHGMALALNSLGAMAREQGNFAAAGHLLEQSLSHLRALNEPRGLAHALGNLGSVALAQGELERAQPLFAESLRLLQAQGAEQAAALCLNNLAVMALGQHRYTEARLYHQQGLEIHRRLGDRQGIALVLSNLAGVESLSGHYAQAHEQFREGLALWKELGNKGGIAYTLSGMAQLAVAQGKMSRAARLLGASEALRAAIHFPIPPVQQEAHDRNVERLMASLGPELFAAAVAEGRALSLEQAVTLAAADT